MKRFCIILAMILSAASCFAQGFPPLPTTMRSASYYLYTVAPSTAAAQIPMDQMLANEQIDFPQVKAYGFNTVLLVEFRAKFEGGTYPNFNGVYDPDGLANFRQELEAARQNGLCVMIGLNYGSGFQIQRGGTPGWYSMNAQLQSWVAFVSYLLTNIDDYRDMVYPVVFEEGQVGSTYTFGQWNDEATGLAATIGNLPALLDPALRSRWTFGWYGAGTGYYADIPSSVGFDWVADGKYYADPSATNVNLNGFRGLTDAQIRADWSEGFDHLARINPGKPIVMFEGGYYTCSSETFERQAEVYALLAQMNLERGYGFNLWGYRSLLTPEQECAERGGKGGHSMGNADGSPRPAMLAVSALLKGSASPLPKPILYHTRVVEGPCAVAPCFSPKNDEPANQ